MEDKVKINEPQFIWSIKNVSTHLTNLVTTSNKHNFGTKISYSKKNGKYLAVGHSEMGNEKEGHIKVYDVSDLNSIENIFEISGEKEHTYLGQTFELSNNEAYLITGEPFYEDIGRIVLYDIKNETFETIFGNKKNKLFGWNVSIDESGHKLCITDRESIFVYQKTDQDSWILLQEIKSDIFEYNGIVMSNNGELIITSQKLKNENEEYSEGQIKTFILNDNNRYLEFGCPVSGTNIDGVDIDYSIDISSNNKFIIVGEKNYNEFKGRVRVYEFVPNGVELIRQVGNDIIGEKKGDHLGSSVCINSDGSIIAVGEEHFTIDNVELGGRVRTFKLVDNKEFKQVGQSILGEINNALIGTSISISDDCSKLLIAEPIVLGENGITNERVRIFEQEKKQSSIVIDNKHVEKITIDVETLSMSSGKSSSKLSNNSLKSNAHSLVSYINPVNNEIIEEILIDSKFKKNSKLVESLNQTNTTNNKSKSVKVKTESNKVSIPSSSTPIKTQSTVITPNSHTTTTVLFTNRRLNNNNNNNITSEKIIHWIIIIGLILIVLGLFVYFIKKSSSKK